MGQCVCLVGNADDGPDEQVDGASLSDPLAMMMATTDGPPVPSLVPTMRDNEVRLIESHRHALVANTTQINLERVLLHLEQWIDDPDKVAYFKVSCCLIFQFALGQISVYLVFSSV